MAEVFDTPTDTSPTYAGSAPDDWHSFALVAPDGRWVANADAGLLTIRSGRTAESVAGLRHVGVTPDWRGLGLFREVMAEALAWCDAQGTAVLLYTEEASLYERFGFRDLVEHAFAGPPPAAIPSSPARPLDLRSSADVATIERIVASRTPLSIACAMDVDAARVLENLRDDDGLAVAMMDEPAAVLVYRREARALVVADVIACAVPSLAEILGALGCEVRRVTTLFPPDRLCWTGTPVAEATGLMIRGRAPDVLTRPFMFPPTNGF